MGNFASRLRAALTERLGQELSPRVCAEIEMAARLGEGSPIEIGRFEPVEHRGYVIAIERFTDVLDELHDLHVKHYSETEKHRQGLPLNPDYQAMADAEASGKMVQFTVRKDGALVGNLRVYVGVSLHTGTPFAVFPTRTKDVGSEEDTLYLLPEHRGGFLAIALLRYAHGVLIDLGMRQIRANSKMLNKAGVLMKRIGYTHIAEMYEFVLEAPYVQ
jgi:GNAT superfamily N-acetyltransferase